MYLKEACLFCEQQKSKLNQIRWEKNSLQIIKFTLFAVTKTIKNFRKNMKVLISQHTEMLVNNNQFLVLKHTM